MRHIEVMVLYNVWYNLENNHYMYRIDCVQECWSQDRGEIGVMNTVLKPASHIVKNSFILQYKIILINQTLMLINEE